MSGEGIVDKSSIYRGDGLGNWQRQGKVVTITCLFIRPGDDSCPAQIISGKALGQCRKSCVDAAALKQDLQRWCFPEYTGTSLADTIDGASCLHFFKQVALFPPALCITYFRLLKSFKKLPLGFEVCAVGS